MHGYTLGQKAKNKASRYRKARKILALLEDHKDLKHTAVLDIGTGAGYIAHEFSKIAKSVDSVDIVDDRLVKRGYRQTLVKDELLPFDDKTFDVVVSNHVLEHVPDHAKHLSEIRRVLKDGGVVYLASPNKWWLTDPHYKLPFISWLPHRVSTLYLKLTKGRIWDIYAASLRQLHKLANQHQFETLDKTWDVMSQPQKYGASIPNVVAAMARKTPRLSRVMLLHIVPTHIKILKLKSRNM